MKIKTRKVIKSDYYDNPDRILIGVDITTLVDIFEENYSEFTGGREFNWDKDGDIFNEASRELDVLIENNFVKKLGHNVVAESYDDNTYILTFWGDRNNPQDIAALETLQSQADDSWTDNGNVELAIYDTEVYAGNISSFLDKWGDKGTEYGVMAEALADSITVGVSFPEEFDSDPNYERVNGMSVRR